jgi:uncharacterized membrane protein YdbT with pleckstrin-like domain
MAIKLRNNEKVLVKADLHWSSYVWPGLSAFFGIVIAMLQIVAHFVVESKPHDPNLALLVGFWLLFTIPLVVRYLKNKFTHYIVTNERVYIETGILARNRIEIPITKINDFQLQQKITQRLLGSGNVAILTGNDKATVLSFIDQPEQFVDALSEITRKKKAA